MIHKQTCQRNQKVSKPNLKQKHSQPQCRNSTSTKLPHREQRHSMRMTKLRQRQLALRKTNMHTDLPSHIFGNGILFKQKAP